MSNSNLMTHCGARKVGIAELRGLPVPVSMGAIHKPVPHIELVELLKGELANSGYQVTREQYAIQSGGLKLFGVMDLTARVLPGEFGDHKPGEERGLSIGFRHGNDRSMRLSLIAGARIFVCDNMAMSGGAVLLKKRHTLNLTLLDEVRASVGQLETEYKALEYGINKLKELSLTDSQAKALIYDSFIGGVMSNRYLETVNDWYFKTPENASDCAPRSAWGVHNAFTRTIKEIASPVVQFQSTVQLGKQFDLVSR